MDEIQNCIADAQYGEALRMKNALRPVQRFPDPGPEFDSKAYSEEQRVAIKSALAEPLGSYFFARYVAENGGTADDACAFECLVGIRDFRRSADPNAVELIQNALKRLPMKFRRLRSFEILSDNAQNAMSGIPLHVSDSHRLSVDALGTEVSGGISAAKATDSRSFAESEELLELERQLRESVKDYWEPFTNHALFDRYMRIKWYSLQPVTLRHFTIFRDLGRGAFGVVSGARVNTTGAMLAIKQMGKRLVKGKKALKLVMAEKTILEKLGNKPSLFTVWLQYSWHDRDNFYLALPLATGGDLNYHLSYQGYFDIERSRFTAAEIVMGLGHLHSLGIIYRDLKPENILLEETGHARISDMGLACLAEGKSVKGRAGTPGYWPPEMLKKEKYGEEVDWWSFGCILYEFLSGRCPFSKQNTGMERDEATQDWKVVFPPNCNMSALDKTPGSNAGPPFPEDAKDLILKLLEREPEKRLGYGRRGTEDIKNHPYFAKIEWSKLITHDLEPPWIPRPLAINAVNQSELDEKNNEYDYRKLKLSEADDIPNFYYVSTFAHQTDIVNILDLEAQNKLQYLDRGNDSFCCSTT